jgi:hypothetical protein
MPKAMKDVNVYFFIQSRNFGKLYQGVYVNYASEFRELFEATELAVGRLKRTWRVMVW